MTHAVTQTEFAALLGKDKSYVTRLKQAGRLVLDADGRVLVAESKQRIEETAEPNRDDVVARHAANRGELPDDDDAGGEIDLHRAIRALERASEAWHAGSGKLPLLSFQEARQIKTNVEALAAGLTALVEAGKLVQADDVRRVVADRLTTLRARLEALPGMLSSPLAAASGEEQIRALLAEYIERALSDLSASFATT